MSKKKKRKDEFYFVVDGSGSMSFTSSFPTKRDQVETGVNGFLDEQAGVDGDAVVSIMIFCSVQGFKMVADRVGLKDFRLNSRNYQTRGRTPLHEACIRGIESIEDPLGPVTFIIATDGLENNSAYGYTKERLQKLIREKTAEGWNFIFLGQDIDAEAEAAKAGVQKATTATVGSFERALQRTSKKVTEYRETGNAERLIYSDEDRAAMS